MPLWYRASPCESIEEAFSGDGGLYVVGRWNHIGNRTIYCSESIALCTMEWLAHNGLSISGFNYYRYSIEISDDLIMKFSASDLPEDWNANPSTDFTRDLAEKYLFSSKKFIAIAVPSVMVPEEYNLVINQSHTKFQGVFKTIKALGQYIVPNR
jgi:RES domain-containing protein